MTRSHDTGFGHVKKPGEVKQPEKESKGIQKLRESLNGRNTLWCDGSIPSSA